MRAERRAAPIETTLVERVPARRLCRSDPPIGLLGRHPPRQAGLQRTAWGNPPVPRFARKAGGARIGTAVVWACSALDSLHVARLKIARLATSRASGNGLSHLHHRVPGRPPPTRLLAPQPRFL